MKDEKKTMIKEMKLADDIKSKEFSILELLFMVIKRYYLGIVRVSFKVWLNFFY